MHHKLTIKTQIDCDRIYNFQHQSKLNANTRYKDNNYVQTKTTL